MLGFVHDGFCEKGKDSLLTLPSVTTPKLIVCAIAPKVIVPAITPKVIVHAITPKEIVHAITPKLIVHAIAPRLIVDAVIPKSISHVVMTLETPTATSPSLAPVLMPKPSHVVTPEWTPESMAPMLSLDDKEPVKSSDAKVVMSPPPCLTIDGDAHGSDTHVVTTELMPNCVESFGAQADLSLPLSSLLLCHASRFATCVASLRQPPPSAEVHIGLSDDNEEHTIVFEMDMIAPLCLFPMVLPMASVSLDGIHQSLKPWLFQASSIWVILSV
jgi:hypothetical protein